jgi:uncharacterized protein (TIGR02145 family)
MRHIYTILLAILVSTGSLAQPPQKMSYQSVIRNSINQLVTSHAVGMRVSIMQGSATGTAVYVETQTPTTNINGLVTIEIGGGTPVTGTFAGIDWSTGTYYIKTETDPSGGTSYTITGTSQLLSVPYALYAKTSEDNPGLKQQIKVLEDNLIAAGTYKLADIEGNQYSVVKIGTQVWMKENLKTTKYNDGTAIPKITDNTAWTALSTPAYCWYNNDETTYKVTYGALYNWYTVNTTGNGGKNLCPTGWHVPSDAEWATLENYLIASGYNFDGTTSGNKIAKSLASISGWTSSTVTGAVGNTDYAAKRNATGFTAVPANFREFDGTFGSIGGYCNFLTATEYDSGNARFFALYYFYSNSIRAITRKRVGLSVRCLRD